MNHIGFETQECARGKLNIFCHAKHKENHSEYSISDARSAPAKMDSRFCAKHKEPHNFYAQTVRARNKMEPAFCAQHKEIHRGYSISGARSAPGKIEFGGPYMQKTLRHHQGKALSNYVGNYVVNRQAS